MDSRNLINDDSDDETSHLISKYIITEAPTIEASALRVQLTQAAEFALIYGASYTTNLCILHHAPANMQHILTYCRDNYIGLEPTIGALTVSAYRALDYIRVVNLPLQVLNIANRLAWDVVTAEATGAVYTAVNHCLLGREVSQPERAVWNVFGPALFRDLKDKAVKAYKYHSLFGHVERDDLRGMLADHTVMQRAYAIKETPAAAHRYNSVATGSASGQPLMVSTDDLSGEQGLSTRSYRQ